MEAICRSYFAWTRFDVSNSRPTSKSEIRRQPFDRDVEDPVEDPVGDLVENDTEYLVKDVGDPEMQDAGECLKDIEGVESGLEIDIDEYFRESILKEETEVEEVER